MSFSDALAELFVLILVSQITTGARANPISTSDWGVPGCSRRNLLLVNALI